MLNSSFNVNFDSTQHSNVVVYVRNYAKSGFPIQASGRIKVEQLKSKIQNEMKVPCQNQVLFLRGRKVCSDDIIQVQNNMIIHLVNIQRVHVKNLSLIFTIHQDSAKVYKRTVNSDMPIELFRKNYLTQFIGENKNYSLMYAGRILSSNKTFREQYIEDCSEILCFYQQKAKENYRKDQVLIKETPKSSETFLVSLFDILTQNYEGSSKFMKKLIFTESPQKKKGKENIFKSAATIQNPEEQERTKEVYCQEEEKMKQKGKAKEVFLKAQINKPE